MRLIAIVLLLLMSSALAFAGYDLHITRKPDWADEVGPKISISEWHEYLKRDRQITRDPKNSVNDFVVSLPNESFPIRFDPKLGKLTVKSPSAEAVKKLIEISKSLKARVQGDDGEFYPLKPKRSVPQVAERRTVLLQQSPNLSIELTSLVEPAHVAHVIRSMAKVDK